MCIKPELFVYVCQDWNWSKYIAPKSDVIFPTEIYDCCPVCNSRRLNRQSPTISPSTVVQIVRNFLKI